MYNKGHNKQAVEYIAINHFGKGRQNIFLVSGGSRVLKRGVPVCGYSMHSAPARGVWGHVPPQKNF